MTGQSPHLERLRNVEAALRQSEERHELALLAGSLGSWVLDLQTMVLESSATCKANFGLGPDDELTYPRLIALILPQDRPAMQAAVARAVSEGVDYVAEYRITWPDSSIHWISAYGRPFVDEDGTPKRMLGTTQNITERKEAEAVRERLLEDNRRARAEAEQAVRLRDEFLTASIHDLRSPLTAMHGRVQLMQRTLSRCDLPEALETRLRTGLAEIEAGTRRMAAMIAELHDVAYLQIGRPLELARDATNVAALVEDCVRRAKQVTHRHRFTIATNTSDIIARIDATRIERVIDNLLSNAIKYSPEGGAVRVWISEEGGWITVAVRDEGVGIPAPEQELIFEPYRRGTNVSERFQGMGIGLAGARSICEQHGGTLTVESEESAGSTFTVRLPVTS